MQVGSWYAGLQPTYNKSNDDESSALAILAQKTPETQSPICLDVLKMVGQEQYNAFCPKSVLTLAEHLKSDHMH